MKICIVTLYKTINSGSYLQAFALKKYLGSLGHEVYFLEINYTLKLRMKRLLDEYKSLIKYGYQEFAFYKKIKKVFHKMQDELNIVNPKKAYQDADLFVFGSDTIWNINSDNLLKLRHIFFGNDFVNKKKISYAASFANSRYETVIKYPDIKDGLEQFNFISVRDENSYNLVKKICDINPYLVCDPTILLDKEAYDSLINICEKDKYIYVYLFADLNTEQKKVVKEFASNNNLKIICGIKKYDWIDQRVSNTPDAFISYINNAEYVITDTFHGTIFSILFNKNFVVINRDKKKVNDFINKCNLTDRIIYDQKINNIFAKSINYKDVNKILDEYKKESIEYLDKAITQ